MRAASASALDRREEFSPPNLRERVEQIQRWAIREALETCEGSWAAAARRLETDPSNLHKLARRLGLKPDR